MLNTLIETRCTKMQHVNVDDHVYFEYDLLYEDSLPVQRFLEDWDNKYGTTLRTHLTSNDIRWKSIKLDVNYKNIMVTFGAFEFASDMVGVKINRTENKDGTETFKYTCTFRRKGLSEDANFAQLYLKNKYTDENGKHKLELHRTEFRDINDIGKE